MTKMRSELRRSVDPLDRPLRRTRRVDRCRAGGQHDDAWVLGGGQEAKGARMFAETARLRCDLTEVTMPDELVVGLTQLTSYRTDLMGDGVARINRLRSLLGSIF